MKIRHRSQGQKGCRLSQLAFLVLLLSFDFECLKTQFDIDVTGETFIVPGYELRSQAIPRLSGKSTCVSFAWRDPHEGDREGKVREEISLSLCFHSVCILQARCWLPLASTRKEITQTIFE